MLIMNAANTQAGCVAST